MFAGGAGVNMGSAHSFNSSKLSCCSQLIGALFSTWKPRDGAWASAFLKHLSLAWQTFMSFTDMFMLRFITFLCFFRLTITQETWPTKLDLPLVYRLLTQEVDQYFVCLMSSLLTVVTVWYITGPLLGMFLAWKYLTLPLIDLHSYYVSICSPSVWYVLVGLWSPKIQCVCVCTRAHTCWSMIQSDRKDCGAPYQTIPSRWKQRERDSDTKGQ